MKRVVFVVSSHGCLLGSGDILIDDGREIARVLRDGGIFCTQQVDGRNMEDLYSLFDMETAYPHVNLAGFQQELERVGMHIQEALDWQGKSPSLM